MHDPKYYISTHGLQCYPFQQFWQALKNNSWHAKFDLYAVFLPTPSPYEVCKDIPFKVKKLLVYPMPLKDAAIHELLCILEASCITLR